MSVFVGLRCAMCKTEFPAEALYVCDQCLGPLEAYYDYEAARRTMTREAIADRPRNLWRYSELLPITGSPRTGFDSGWTPLVRAGRLGEALGVTELYIKDDSVNHPTCPTRTASCRWRRRARSSSDSTRSDVPRPATSATAWRRIRPAWV